METLRHKRLVTTMEHYTHRVTSQQQAAQGLFLAAIGRTTPAVEAIHSHRGLDYGLGSVLNFWDVCNKPFNYYDLDGGRSGTRTPDPFLVREVL